MLGLNRADHLTGRWGCGLNYVHQIPDYIVLGLTRGSMYALIALGYTLVYGVLQLINFAHSEVFMSGAFGSYLVVQPDRGQRRPRARCGRYR